jgi:Carbohydrate-binding module 48 (Isoamylase N-terminal domain)
VNGGIESKMTDAELDPIVERIVHEARRPVATDPDARERLHAVIRAELGTDRASGKWNSAKPRAISLTMPWFAALAAGLVGIGVLVGLNSNFGRDGRMTGQPLAAGGKHLPASDTLVTFVFPAPAAEKVSVVGDFNQWDTTATPMKRIDNTDFWSVTVPMSIGRHIFSYFAVTKDGERWSADPTRPAAPDDGFGRANSVVLVGKGSAL